ncbi:hypothetical protein CRG98_009969 [Punica granatum]|uniref:Uncharacterized protein n=1 Tax=Punica granatum TaxID=22663 RepID=A0A2I0KMB6_PUNGR|nr:hypothetical protein CRG98_009969 [Punica granatum]
MAYRIQNHALDLSLPGSEEALIISVDSVNAPACVHVPRQIARADLVKLLLETWVTNYERLHQNAQPIQSSEPKFGKRPDKKVVISFGHRPIENPEPSAPPMFQTMMMMQSAEKGVRDNPKVQKQMHPVHSFMSNGMPVKKRKELPCSGEAKKKADPKTYPGADTGLSTVLKKKKVLPSYKPILKWVRKQKWENLEEIRDYLKDMMPASISERLVHKMEQKGEIAAIPQAAPTYCNSLWDSSTITANFPNHKSLQLFGETTWRKSQVGKAFIVLSFSGRTTAQKGYTCGIKGKGETGYRSSKKKNIKKEEGVRNPSRTSFICL